MHFAPTERAAAALIEEDVPASRILITGNTAIDALLHTRELTRSGQYSSRLIAQLKAQCRGRQIILVTAHRRENQGAKMQEIAQALRSIASSEDVDILFPVHPSLAVRKVMTKVLSDVTNIFLLPPISYPEFVQTIEICDLILTDSGGIQEEAPTLGKPVLVMRNETERPEAIEAGTARLVGSSKAQIVRETRRLLHDTDLRARMSRQINPFGDGRASERIVERLATAHGVN